MTDRQHCKVFVGGLNWETTDEKLRRYFENYGTVVEAFVSYDRVTMKPRGFGFVVFEDPAVADKVVKLQHTIDRREVEAKKAVPKDEGSAKPIIPPSSLQATRTRKCFVGGLPVSADEQVLRTYFEQFGQVDDAVVMYDHDNKRPRGFGFVTFASEDSVDRCLAKGSLQLLQDKQIEVKRAVPKDQMQQATAPQHVAAPAAYSAIPVAQPSHLAAYPPGTIPTYIVQQQHVPLGVTHSSMGSAGQSFPSISVPIAAPQQQVQQVQLTPQQQQLLLLQQQGKLHSTAVAAQLGVLTNTMTGVVGTPGHWVTGHSAPAGPAGGLPGAYPQQVTHGALNLASVQGGPAYASIAAPDGGLGSHLVWDVSGNAGAAPLGLVHSAQGGLQLATTFDPQQGGLAVLGAAGGAQLGAAAPQQAQLAGGNAALWNATTAAVLGSGTAVSLPLQQALQNGSSSNSSYLEVPLSFS